MVKDDDPMVREYTQTDGSLCGFLFVSPSSSSFSLGNGQCIYSSSLFLSFFRLSFALWCLVSFQGLVSDVSIVVLLSPYGACRVLSFAM